MFLWFKGLSRKPIVKLSRSTLNNEH